MPDPRPHQPVSEQSGPNDAGSAQPRPWSVKAYLRPGEGLPAFIAIAFFFCVLCGYFFVRPVREAFGVERGMSGLYTLFFATMVVSLLVSPVFSWLVSRFNRRIFLPLSYGVVALMMLGFAAYRHFSTDESVTELTGQVFFVWLSVVNLFMTGLFWSLMSDCFGPAQSRRMFPLVAVGGTLGALFGSAGAWAVSGYPFEIVGWELFDPGITLSAPLMMVVSAGFVVLAAALAVAMSATAPQKDRAEPARAGGFAAATEGLRLAFRSKYLLAISGYIGMLAVLSTFLYFTQAEIVSSAEESEGGRIAVFSQIDFFTQLATLILQLVLTSQLIRWLGTGITMCILPCIAMLGIALLAIGEKAGASAVFMVNGIMILQAVFRASKYAIARPARETLFTVLSREEKYKAKNLIDTFVYRAGDTAGAGVNGLLAMAAASLAGLAATVAPIAIGMAGLALYLGASQQRRAAGHDETAATPTHTLTQSGAAS